MKKNELLNLLNQMDKQEDDSSGPHDRVLLIDGLNLFFRNFAMMNFVNEQGVHIGGLGGFIRSLNSLINQIKPTSVYVVFDGTGSSVNRKNLLPEYKSGRNLSRITNWDAFDSLEDEHDSKIDQIVRLIHYLKCLPVKTLSLDKVEADDIIAYLSNILPNKHNSQVFIVSNDKDFQQLQRYPNVFQYSTFKKQLLVCDNPYDFLMEHILRGDSGDGVPNILSDDDVFVVDDKRQNRLTQKVITEIKENINTISDSPHYRNWDRNKTLIDFDMIPEQLETNIISEFNKNSSVTDRSKVLPYMITNRLKNLIEIIEEF